MNKLIAFLLAILLLNGCSIEKRHYRKGYSVNWFIHKNTTKSVLKKAQPVSGEPIITASASKETPVLLKRETPETNQSVVIIPKKQHVKHKVKPGLFIKDRSKKRTEGTEDVAIVPTAATVSFVSSILSVLLYIFIAINPYFWLASFVVAVIAIIAGITGLIQIHNHNTKYQGKGYNHKTKYKGKGYAIAGIIIGTLAILVGWFIALLILTG